MVDLAQKDPSLGEAMREILWRSIQGDALLEESDTDKGWWFSFWSDIKEYEKQAGRIDEDAERQAEPETQDETIVQQSHKLICDWLNGCTYREKLAAIALWQLSNKDDADAATPIFEDFEKEIIEASSEPVRLSKEHDGDDEYRARIVAVTSAVAALIPITM